MGLFSAFTRNDTVQNRRTGKAGRITSAIGDHDDDGNELVAVQYDGEPHERIVRASALKGES